MKVRTLFYGLTIVMTSCSQGYDELDFNRESEEVAKSLQASTRTLEDDLQYSSWKEFLDNLIRRDGSKWLQKQHIKLLSYELVREGISLSDTDSTVSESSIVPIYNDTCNINQFELITIAEARSKIEASKMIDYSLFKRTLLSQYIGQKLSLVKLKWEYKQKAYTTECIVSPRSVAYDDFLLNIREISTYRVDDIAIPTALHLTRSESGNSIGYYFCSQEVTWQFMGAKVARAFCTVSVNGYEYPSAKSIETRKEEGHSTAKMGFSAQAEVKINSFKTGTDGYCDYIYGIVAGPAGASFTWTGSSVNFIGGGNHAKGGEYVRPYMLN